MTQKGPLTVWDLLYHINSAIKEKQIGLKTPLIYSSDDEGNSYQCPVFLPSTIIVNKKPTQWKRYYSEDIFWSSDKPETPFTCLCLN